MLLRRAAVRDDRLELTAIRSGDSHDNTCSHKESLNCFGRFGNRPNEFRPLEAKKYMIIKLDETYYHYCNIGPQTVSSFLAAPSMGRYYNSEIRGRGDLHGPFDCRDHPIPSL